ncbi:hypothetical protein B0H14DRAFT_3512791 [Mycena olivaceomarginata]|nr:hypothetical protein B0H14DRAFT_3512791 [Mycena olivaceomarginata]
MAPPEWTTVAQKEYLQNQLPAFLSATEKRGTSLARFWGNLKEGWFERWPTETTLGVSLPPATGEDDVRSNSQILAVGRATDITQKRLKPGCTIGVPCYARRVPAWGLSLLKRKKSTRPYRKIEIYQRLYAAKLKEEANRRGYGLLNEEAAAEGVAMAEARVMSEMEAAAAELAQNEATEARLKESRRQRMKVDQETAARNEERTATASEDMDERTPEDMQLAINELGEVAKIVLESMAVATGWQFMLVGGGPSPRHGGNIQVKTICFGTTAHGTNFRGSHPNFDEAVLTPFIKYLKRVFPHEIRDARALAADNDEEEEGEDDPLAGLFTMDERPPRPEATKPKRMRRTKPRPKSAAAIPAPVALPSGTAASTAAVPAPHPLVVPTETEYRTPVHPPPQARPELISVPDNFDETMRAINYHFENTAGPPPLDWDLNHDEDIGAFTGGSSESSNVTHASSLAYDGPPRMSGTQLDSQKLSLHAEHIIRRPPLPRIGPRPPRCLLVRLLRLRPRPPPPPAGVPVAPVPTPPPAGAPVLPAPAPAPAGAPVMPAPAPPPPGPPVAPEPASTPAGAPVAPAPAPPPTDTPVAPVPTPPPAYAPVAPAPAPPLAGALVAPAPAPPPAGAPVAPAPTLPPAPVIPHYPVSRPMANTPKGHPLAAPAAAQVTTPATKSKPGRPRKTVEPAIEMGVGLEEGMTPDARAESDRIHREENQLREIRKEMLRRGRAADERSAAATAEEQRLVALVHNPAGGAPLTIVQRPLRAIKATLDPEGNPLIHPVVQTRGDLGNGGRLALRVLGSDALQAQEDAQMLEKLSGKKAAGTKKAPAAKKVASNDGDKP